MNSLELENVSFFVSGSSTTVRAQCHYATDLHVSSQAFGVKTNKIQANVGNLDQKGDLSDGFSLKFYES